MQGVEDPRARDLTRAPNANAAIRRFAGKQTLRIETAREGLYLRFPSVQKRPSLAPAEEPIDAADRLISLFFLCDWRARLAKCREVTPGKDAGKEIECGRYFELKHWKRVYKRGTFCPGCQRAHSFMSAVRATSKARVAAERALYDLAAKRFTTRLRAPEWHRDFKLRAKIIEFINRHIRKSDSLTCVYPHGITGKWLSWSKNRGGIAEAARGEGHPKS